MFVCSYCGKKKISGSPTKYGLCQECNQKLRNEVLTQLDAIKGIIEQFKTVPDDPADCKIALYKTEEGLKAVENLENARDKYPFFKSSTDEYSNQLETIRDSIKEKLKSFDLPETSESAATVAQVPETSVNSQPAVKAKEPFYKNSMFIAIVITAVIVIAMVFYIGPHPGSLGITLDEFQESFNTRMSSIDSELRIVSIDWEDGEAAASGKISEHLAFVFFLKDTDTREIKSLLFLGSGDGTAQSAVDLFLCLVSTIVSVDPSIEFDKAGPMIEEMLNDDPNHMVTKNRISYECTQDSEIGTTLHIFPKE